MSDSYRLIRQAILDQQPVSLQYKGTYRVICPYVIGAKGRRQQFLGYQIGGESNTAIGPTGSPKNWRCMFVDQVTDVEPQPDLKWGTAAPHTRPQTCVDMVDVEVAY